MLGMLSEQLPAPGQPTRVHLQVVHAAYQHLAPPSHLQDHPTTFSAIAISRPMLAVSRMSTLHQHHQEWQYLMVASLMVLQVHLMDHLTKLMLWPAQSAQHKAP